VKTVVTGGSAILKQMVVDQVQVAANWSSLVQWRSIFAGELNGDGKSDLVAMENGPGTSKAGGNWWQSLSATPRYATSFAGSWPVGVSFLARALADFDGDGKNDFMGVDEKTGNIYVTSLTATSIKGAFSEIADKKDFGFIDFNNDGRSDIVCRDSKSGKWTAAIAGISGFTMSDIGSWITE
jgi:hypothetical protein